MYNVDNHEEQIIQLFNLKLKMYMQQAKNY
jgi:hypothetical protein